MRLDETYTTPMYHHNPMEPHATIAIWTDDGLTLYVGSHGVHLLRAAVAAVFGLDPRRVRVISPNVGGGFGSKYFAHADVVPAAMAARLVAGRLVKLALTRQQMFSQDRDVPTPRADAWPLVGADLAALISSGWDTAAGLARPGRRANRR